MDRSWFTNAHGSNLLLIDLYPLFEIQLNQLLKSYMASASSTPALYDSLLGLFNKTKYNQLLSIVASNHISTSQDPFVAQLVAGSHFYLGNFAKAAEILEHHIDVLGEDTNFLSMYGAICRRNGQLDQAKVFLEKAISIDSKSRTIRNNYANLLIDLGDLVLAKSILVKLLAEDPSYSDAQANLNRLTFREKHDTAKTDNTHSVDEPWAPADPLLLAFAEEEVSKAGSVNFKKPKSDEALGLASRLPNPEKVSVATDKLKLATKAIEENNPNFALQLISSAASDLGSQASIYMNAADAYIRLDRFYEAEICYLHTLQIGGHSLPAYINLTTLALIRGDLALSQHYLDKASSIDPDSDALVKLRAQVHKKASSTKHSYLFLPAWENIGKQRITKA